MMRSLTALRFAAAASLLCATSVAQSHFCTGGNLDHLSQAERAQCAAKLQMLRSVATQLNTPENWHYVLVCGEEGWKQYSEYASGNDAALNGAAVDTNFAARETFFRESRLDLGNVAAVRATIAHVTTGLPANTSELATAQSRDHAAQASGLAGAL